MGRGNRADTAEALDFLARGKIKVIYEMRIVWASAGLRRDGERGNLWAYCLGHFKVDLDP